MREEISKSGLYAPLYIEETRFSRFEAMAMAVLQSLQIEERYSTCSPS